jgi:ribulose-phosphate 3-epimerase
MSNTPRFESPKGNGNGSGHKRSVRISPSLMCADAARLLDDVQALEAVGVDLLHFDIMDGQFVPNMPLGLGVLSALRGKTSIPFDVHLMVQNNDWFIEQIADIGAEYIAVHAESAVHLDRSLSLIRSNGIQAGAALNPATPLEALTYVVDRLDFVLIMTVNPGYAGQKLVPATIQKIADCREFLTDHGSKIPISVDGNVSFENIPPMVKAGADILVAGTSSLYAKGATIRENMDHMQERIGTGLGSGADSPAEVTR